VTRGNGLAKRIWGTSRVEGLEPGSGGRGERSNGVRGSEETSGSREVTLLDLGLDAVWEGDGSASRARARDVPTETRTQADCRTEAGERGRSWKVGCRLRQE
jgi:hypothetical protein